MTDEQFLSEMRAFRQELHDWQASQDLTDPNPTNRSDEPLTYERFDEMRRRSDRAREASHEHHADEMLSYRERFTTRALAIYDAFGEHGMAGEETRYKFAESGGWSQAVEKVIEELDRRIAELDARLKGLPKPPPRSM